MNAEPKPDEEANDPFSAPIGAGLDFTDPNSPLAPYYLSPGHVAAAVLLALVFTFYAFFPLHHTDIWGHMAFGRWMVTHGRLPDREPFCPFAEKDGYVHFQWLSQAGFYLLYHLGERLAGGGPLARLAGGVEMLRLSHAVLATAVYAFLLAAYRRTGGSLGLACAATGVLLLLAPAHIAVLRPQVIGVVFFAWLFFCLCRNTLSRASLLGLPVLFMVWANVHGSFAVGLVVVAGFLAGRILEVARKERTLAPARLLADLQTFRLLVVLGASVLLIAVANPHGPMLYRHTLELGQHPNVRTMDEWRPLSLRLAGGGHWAFLAAVLLLLVSQHYSPRWLTPTHLLLLIGFGVWAWMQQRMMIWWLPLVPWGLVYLWGGWEKARAEGTASFRLTLLVGAVVIIAVLLSPVTSWLRQGKPRPLDRAVSGGTPWRLAAELTATEEERGTWLPDLSRELAVSYPDRKFRGVIFASEGEGDYLVWALPPDYPVFVYTHGHLFSPEHWNDCQRVKFAEEGWRQVLDRNRINLVLFEAETFPDIVAQLRHEPGWTVLVDETGDRRKRDPRARLFLALRNHPL